MKFDRQTLGHSLLLLVLLFDLLDLALENRLELQLNHFLAGDLLELENLAFQNYPFDNSDQYFWNYRSEYQHLSA